MDGLRRSFRILIVPFATVRNEYNAVQVQGAFAEKQLFIGKGAGSYPTGSAVLSDISALTYGYRYEYKKFHQEANLEFSNEVVLDVYVSFDQQQQVRMEDFVSFEAGYAFDGKRYMVGKVHLEKLREWMQVPGVGIILSSTNQFTPVETNLRQHAFPKKETSTVAVN